MRNKLFYCIPLALSITCLIGCASKAAQTPADPEAVTMLPSQEQQAIVPEDTKSEMLFNPQGKLILFIVFRTFNVAFFS